MGRARRTVDPAGPAASAMIAAVLGELAHVDLSVDIGALVIGIIALALHLRR
jgi:hypothetical protein